MRCPECDKPLDQENDGRPVAAISGSVMGDEYTDCFYYCANCKVYIVAGYRDCFGGDDLSRGKSVISKKQGDQEIALINKCKNPSNKRCRCAAHRKYFGKWLD